MTARCAVYAHVTSKDGTRRAWLQPGDPVPDWARLDARNLASGSQPADETPAAAAPPPARSGKGSGAEAWRAYAERHGVDVTADMSRDDIIAACEQAGVVLPEE
ncbi:hypothetical protein [Streptomyces rimosus]|uniref:hypothetical protein n=1 Tax=Streptomyces rimosus TaxID=1927 RepID=UPI00051847F4|nr:hypothetical protein [Streptomyces rimosus]